MGGRNTYLVVKICFDEEIGAQSRRARFLWSRWPFDVWHWSYFPPKSLTFPLQDVSDKMIIVDLLAFAIDNPSPATVILISGDRDFVYAISTLRHRRYRVVLIVPKYGSHISLKSQASTVLEWQYDILQMSNNSAGLNPSSRISICETDIFLRQDTSTVFGRPIFPP